MNLGERLRQIGFWASDFLKGRAIASQISDIQRQLADPDLRQRLCEQRLQDLMRHASETTPFYTSYRGAKRLDALPVIDKRTVRENYEGFFSSRYQRSSLVPVTTSGSYGTPFTFYLTKEKKARQQAEVIVFGRWAGYRVGMRHGYVRVTKTKSPWKLFLQNEVLLNPQRLDTPWLMQAREQLLRSGVRVIIGYPSATGALAEYCRVQGDRPKDFSVTAVVTSAEPLHESVRQSVQAVFGVTPSSRYSTEEFGVLAQEDPQTRKHMLNTPSYVIEVLEQHSDVPASPGKLGRIVVTDLFSHAMPLIRYDLGDLGVLSEELAPPWGLPALDALEGREVESVFDSSGHRVSPFAVNGAMRDMQGVVQFQFIQTGAKDYTLRLVVLPDFSEEHLVRQRMLELLGNNAALGLEYVATIPPLPSGKRPYILNRVPVQPSETG